MTVSIPRLVVGGLNASPFWREHRLILREIRYFPKVAIAALSFSLLAAMFEGIGVGFLLSFLQNLTDPNAAPVHTNVGWIDQWVLNIQGSASDRIYRISALILLTTWIRAAFNYLSSVYVEFSQFNLMDQLRKRIFEQLQSFHLSYFSKTRSGELINTITTEIERFKLIFSGVAFLLTRGLTVTVYFISMFAISWQLSIISLLLFALLAVGLATLNRRVRTTSSAITQANGRFTSIAIELITGIRTVHAFAANDLERQRYYQASQAIVKASQRSTVALSLVRPLAEGFATTILVGMIVVAFNGLVLQGTLPVAALLTFFFVLFRLVPSLQDINGVRAQINFLNGSADNIKALLRTDDKPYIQNGSVEFLHLRRAIEFIAVDFSYEPDQPVLRQVSFTIEQGKMTALVGASGAGKTTVADLIPRLYDPTAGAIFIDGVDLRQLDIGSLRRKMAIVSQDTFIFNTSIRENIAYGSEHVTDCEIVKAAQLANALEFIQQTPAGFDTVLGDQGVRLSGGQRQRIAIARALLRNPEILILDEATSALDSVSERLIQAALETLAVGRTVIAIAHRLSTIVRADTVVVLEQGQVVEQGPYQTLLRQQGKLWAYHQMQQMPHNPNGE